MKGPGITKSILYLSVYKDPLFVYFIPFSLLSINVKNSMKDISILCIHVLWNPPVGRAKLFSP